MAALIDHLCRDCLADFEAGPGTERCPECGSSRLVAHHELQSLNMAHIDCDAFYASIEKRDNPDLVDKPLIVGGGQRGVVSTCCYIARMSGVRSAMPMVTALRKCPDAVVIRPDMAKYVEVSRQIREGMFALSPQVEPLSIDEAFIDMAGTQKVHRAYPARALARFARTVEAEIGVTISIGLSHNKFLAKVTSDFDKPRGLTLIGRAETLDFLADKPISIIYGVGKVMNQKLKRDGFVTIGQLQNHDPDDLMRRYGETGARLARLSRGEDRRHLSTSRNAKSVSTETTFFKDIAAPDELSRRLLDLCERLSERLKKSGVVGDTITLKLKTAGFQIRTRARHLPVPTQLAHVLYDNAEALLEREADGLTAFRLIGVGVSHIERAGDADPTDLVDPGVARRAAAERAMDKVRTRFGQEAVVRGKLYRQKHNSDTSDEPAEDRK